VDGAGGPGGGFSDETAEDRLGGEADVVTALGMPLDAEDEVGFGSFGGLATFDGFNNSVLGAAGGDAEAVAGNANGLMVAGIDGETQETVLRGSFFGGNDGSEERVGCDGGGVGDGYGFARGVVDREDVEVLDESAAAPDVEGLEAEADGKDRFVEIVGVLNEKFVDIFPGGVGGAALGDGVLAVFLGVDVGGAAGEEDGLAGVDEVGDLGGSGFEGDFDGLASATLDGGGVGWPRALVVGGVGAGGDRNGYAGLHAAFDDTADDGRFARIARSNGITMIKRDGQRLEEAGR